MGTPAEIGVPPAPEATPTSAKIFTTLVHVVIVVAHILLLHGAEGSAAVSPQLCGAHFAILLGLWGPKSLWGLWWNPSPVNEAPGVALFLLLGIVEYVGIGMVSYYRYLDLPCDENGETLVGLVQELSQNARVAGLSAADFVNGSFARNNCTVDADGNTFVAPCDACGCKSCPVDYLTSWLDTLIDGDMVSFERAVYRELEVNGCEIRDDTRDDTPVDLRDDTYLGDEVFRDETPVKRLTFIDLLWFCIVLLTTVGYGNTFVPNSSICRQFTMSWSFIGLFIFGASWSSCVEALSGLATDTRDRILRKLRRPEDEAARAEGPTDERDYSLPALYYSGRDLFSRFLVFLAVNFGGALVFWCTEDGWHYSDGFYHCMMTATTIGLGDIAPTSQAGRAWGIVQMLLSVALLGSLIGSILSGLERRVEANKKEELLKKQLDEEMIRSLDKDGNGVDKAEFVLGMLQILGKVTEEDYAPFLAQFAELDKSGDGRLTCSDLSHLAQQNLERAEETEKRKTEALKTFKARVEGHAMELLGPTFLSCTAFAMNISFGYILMGTGLVSALAIGWIISGPRTPRSYEKIAMVVALAGLGYAFATALTLVFIIDTRKYENFDAYAANQGQLNDEGITTKATAAYRNWRIREFHMNGYALTLFGTYLAAMAYAITTCCMTAMCCLKCAEDLQQHQQLDEHAAKPKIVKGAVSPTGVSRA